MTTNGSNLIDYVKSLNCFLPSPSQSSHVNKKREQYAYELLFQQDCNGNTPYSYAIKQWDNETIFRLLKISAGLSKQDMKLISPKVFEQFLNEKCVSRIIENNETVIAFDFSFLLRKSTKKPTRYGEDIEQSKSIFLGIREKIGKTFHNFGPFTNIWQRISKSSTTGLEEDVDVLHHIVQSDKHRYLVTHPVIRTYLWIRWLQIQLPLRRYKFAFLLFLASLVWFGFDLFGGKQWKASGRPNIITNRADEDFCNKNNRTLIANILNGSYFLASENFDYPNGLSF